MLHEGNIGANFLVNKGAHEIVVVGYSETTIIMQLRYLVRADRKPYLFT